MMVKLSKSNTFGLSKTKHKVLQLLLVHTIASTRVCLRRQQVWFNINVGHMKERGITTNLKTGIEILSINKHAIYFETGHK